MKKFLIIHLIIVLLGLPFYIFAQGDSNNQKAKDSILKVSLEEVEVMAGVLNLSKDRETPIAVSNITAQQIESKGGFFDLIEVMRTSPGIQVNRGGGFGDGNMYLRGFDHTNTAFLINGQPINGVEDGKMYWSNWSGMIDVAEEIEIQRGLGSSNLAISSVGGTVNIVTKAVDQKAGGFVKTVSGYNNYLKTSAYLSTGLMDNGFAASFLFGHWQGDGYHESSIGQGQTYFFSLGYKPNDNHILNLLLTGAPQWHGVGGEGKLSVYLEKDNSQVRPGTWMGILNEKIYPGGRNFYHKPLFNLSWDWKINSNSKLSTVLYGSQGRGGFAYGEGKYYYDAPGGRINFDKIITENALGNSEGIVKSSINSHNWYGIISNFSSKIGENINYNIGIDGRTYNGIHFRTPTNFLGLKSYKGATKLISYDPWEAVFDFPNKDRSAYAISYDYEEVISYFGFFGQLEYATDSFSTFLQASYSNQNHVKEDFKFGLGKADEITNDGYNFKIGAAINSGSNSKIYANFGTYSRQPFHDDLYNNIRYSNTINTRVENQTITGFEVGYIYEVENFQAIIDLYSTEWSDRIQSTTNFNSNNEAVSSDRSTPFGQIHQGVEIQLNYRPNNNSSLYAYASIGDWKYKGNIETTTYDEKDNLGAVLSTGNKVYIDGVKVGNAAQTSYGFDYNYKFNNDFNISITGNHYDNLYAGVDFGNSEFSSDNNRGSVKIPAFSLIDASFNFKLPISNYNDIDLRFSIYNLFDVFHIEKITDDMNHADGTTDTWNGLDTSQEVDPGLPRTWAISAKYRF